MIYLKKKLSKILFIYLLFKLKMSHYANTNFPMSTFFIYKLCIYFYLFIFFFLKMIFTWWLYAHTGFPHSSVSWSCLCSVGLLVFLDLLILRVRPEGSFSVRLFKSKYTVFVSHYNQSLGPPESLFSSRTPADPRVSVRGQVYERGNTSRSFKAQETDQYAQVHIYHR